MLVITRNVGQSILLFSGRRHLATITMVARCRKSGKSGRSIGILTDDDIQVLRGELTTKDGQARYTCAKCLQIHYTDHKGPTFDCPRCGARAWQLTYDHEIGA